MNTNNLYKGLELLGLSAEEITALAEVLDIKLQNSTESIDKYHNILTIKTSYLKTILSGKASKEFIDSIVERECLHFFTVKSGFKPDSSDPLSFGAESNVDSRDFEMTLLDIYLGQNEKDTNLYTMYKQRLESQGRTLIMDALMDITTEADIDLYLSQHQDKKIQHVGSSTVPFIYKLVLVYNIIKMHSDILKSYVDKSYASIKSITKLVEVFKNASDELADFRIETETVLVSKDDANSRIKNSNELLIRNIKDLLTENNISNDLNLELEKDFTLSKHLFN